MSPKCPTCPIDGECRSYAHLCRRHAEEPARWRPIVDRVNSEGHRAEAAESLRLLDEMRACDHRIPEESCDCGGLARCVQGKGDRGLVNHLDCMACLGKTALG